MEKLTKREDQIMQIVWRLKKAFIRDIVAGLPQPPPHYNTVATLVKILVQKEMLAAEKVGNTYQYYPTPTFEAYREAFLNDIKEQFFENSLPKLLAHFARKEKLTPAEKEELIRIIESDKS